MNMKSDILPPNKPGGGYLPAMKGKPEYRNKQRTAKTFFANERTLLSWVNTVTFLSLSGLTLLNTDTAVGRYSGTALIIITIAFAVYAFRKYRQRLGGLQKETLIGFEDKIGPGILIGTFCTVLLFISVYFGFHDFLPSALYVKKK